MSASPPPNRGSPRQDSCVALSQCRAPLPHRFLQENAGSGPKGRGVRRQGLGQRGPGAGRKGAARPPAGKEGRRVVEGVVCAPPGLSGFAGCVGCLFLTPFPRACAGPRASPKQGKLREGRRGQGDPGSGGHLLCTHLGHRGREALSEEQIYGYKAMHWKRRRSSPRGGRCFV